LNRKCSFSIQLHPIESNWIQLNPKKKYSLFKIRIRIEKEFISILIHSRLLDNTYVYIIKQDNTQTDYIKKINIFFSVFIQWFYSAFKYRKALGHLRKTMMPPYRKVQQLWRTRKRIHCSKKRVQISLTKGELKECEEEE